MACLSKTGIIPRRARSESVLQWLVLATIVIVYVICGFAADTWAQTYRGKVVDAETEQPLEGAVFVIVWNKKPAVSMNGPRYFHSAKEVLTNAQGEFSVDGSPGVDWNPFTYIVKNPSIGIFMRGYGPFPTGHVKETTPDELKKAMIVAGVVIKLPKLKNEEELRRYAAPDSLDIPSDTPYEQIPNVIRLLNIHRKLAGLSSFYKEPTR